MKTIFFIARKTKTIFLKAHIFNVSIKNIKLTQFLLLLLSININFPVLITCVWIILFIFNDFRDCFTNFFRTQTMHILKIVRVAYNTIV